MARNEILDELPPHDARSLKTTTVTLPHTCVMLRRDSKLRGDLSGRASNEHLYVP